MSRFQDSGITGKTTPLAPSSDERDGEHQAAGAESDSKANRVADNAFHDLFLLLSSSANQEPGPVFALAT